MAKPNHQTPEYRAAYRAIVRAQRAGQWLWCHESTCLMPTRDIAPTQAADVCHDVSGTIILGPGHRRCNRSEGARRGNRMRGVQPARWVM